MMDKSPSKITEIIKEKSNETAYDFNIEDFNYSFRDLFDLEEIQKILDAFTAATGVGTIITEPDGTPISQPSNFCGFCYNIVRSTEKGIRNCMISDAVIGKPKKDGPRIQKCLSAGLIDAGASIMVGDKHIANWLIGQILDKDANIDEMVKYADEIGVDKQKYIEGIKEVPKMSMQQFTKVAEFLFIFAKMLSELAFRNAVKSREIERRIAAEQQLAKEKELFKVTIQSIGDAVITTDINGNITSLNEVAEALTGWKNEEAIGLPLGKVFNIINEKTRKKCVNPVEKVLSTGKTVTLANHTVLISKDNVERAIADSGAPIKNEAGEILGVVLVFRDVTEAKRKQDEIEYLTYHDKLTGLFNRTYFEKKLEKIEASGVFPTSIIIGDVNGLKITNDIFGHGEGDELLKAIARILEKSCRKNDIIARWGGDEFSVILPETDYETARRICERIKKICETYKDLNIQPSIALGLDTKENNTQKLKDVVKKAEDRMYRNKLLESKSKKSGTVLSLQRTLFEKSYETEEHALRIIELSQKLGRMLGLHENELDDLKLLAGLHDIGKVAISDTILTKAGKLSDEEWEEMKKHCEIGYRIANSALEISHVSEYILCHHERWDGTGYPQGRKGEEIPLLSRIISVVDAYDVMTNVRIYKDKMSKKEALEEIRRCAGTQFDPHIAETFIELMSE